MQNLHHAKIAIADVVGFRVKRAIADVVGLDSKRAYFSQQTNPVPSTLYPLPIIQFLKVMYLILTLQVPLTLPSVFSKTDSVCSPRRHPEVCIN